MATIYSNYKVIPLSGTMGTGDLGDGVTASTVHRIFCIGAGNVTIRPFEGSSFTWTAANANDYLDVVVSGLTVNSGTFIGFAAKMGNQGYKGFGPY
jgi:hypothetical protein